MGVIEEQLNGGKVALKFIFCNFCTATLKSWSKRPQINDRQVIIISALWRFYNLFTFNICVRPLKHHIAVQVVHISVMHQKPGLTVKKGWINIPPYSFQK